VCSAGILEAVPAIGTWISRVIDSESVPSLDWTVDQQSGNITYRPDPSDLQPSKVCSQTRF
jgi:hypothetical protein